MDDSRTLEHFDPTLASSYSQIRRQSETLCEPLISEDYVVQTMPDVSPPKWHLAHVTWFFESFVLKPYVKGYGLFDPTFFYLFNSYYQGIGEPFPRCKRGLLSRPSVAQIMAYRHHVDEHLNSLLSGIGECDTKRRIIELIVLGLNHEQQHQELLLTDIKHIFAENPLSPVYRNGHADELPRSTNTSKWILCPGGEVSIGYEGDAFHFDNETPRHKVIINDFSLADRLVTNADYLEFIDEGGYGNPLLWLSDGWTIKNQGKWMAPLYWQEIEGVWHVMTLAGLKRVEPQEPVCHVSYYEADAFATWAGNRLPKEEEWETAAGEIKRSANFLESGRFHPSIAGSGRGVSQMFGDVWEWTQSPYSPYPGYRVPQGVLGEYNGKFMCNQLVLRGGSCVTPADHIRKTYRNFFYPHQRWQFMGFRLAKDS